MEVKRSLFVFVMAFVITLLLLFIVLFVSKSFDDERKKYIETEFEKIADKFDDIRSLLIMTQTYGTKMLCIISRDKLRELDESIWSLGKKIDNYKQVSEEFFKSPYFLKQKKIFNEQEIIYLNLLRTLKQKCGFSQPIILFFYKNSEDCSKCDDQSFVLIDINEEINDEISVFSFDMDLDLKALDYLKQFYEIEKFPCLVIDDVKYCGMQDKKVIIDTMCKSYNLSICPK